MRHTYVSDEMERIAFAERAARSFKANARLWTYTDAEIVPGCLFASRWGLGDDCVLVLRLGDDVPVIFGQLVKQVDA